MAVKEEKHKDIEFYSDWNIDRTIAKVEGTYDVDNNWRNIYVTNDGSLPKFYAFVMSGGKWYQAGYKPTAVQFRSVSNRVQYKSYYPATWRMKVYIMSGSVNAL